MFDWFFAMRQLKAAVIGTGFIGPVHVEALRRLAIPVQGILGSTVEKSVAAAAKLQLPKAYATLEELLADDQVDVVHVTSPNQFHFDQTVAILNAGKHVLCEKPLAMTSQQSAQLVRLADQTGLAAAVNYNIRYYPLCQEAAAQMRAGKLGRLYHVGGSYVQDWLFHETDFNWRVSSSAGGALRAVADIGTHWLDLIQFVTNEKVVSVCSDLQTVFPQRSRPLGGAQTFSGGVAQDRSIETIDVDTEDCGSVLLRFASGAKGVLWVSQVTAGRKNCLQFELSASKQAVAWCSQDPNQLWIGHRDQPNQLLIRDPAMLSSAAQKYSDYPGGHNEGFPDSFKQLCRDFYETIASGNASNCSLSAMHEAARMKAASVKAASVKAASVKAASVKAASVKTASVKTASVKTASVTYPTFADGHREILLCEAILASHQQERWVHLEN